jgi:hypothetical protein
MSRQGGEFRILSSFSLAQDMHASSEFEIFKEFSLYSISVNSFHENKILKKLRSFRAAEFKIIFL